MTPRVSTVDQGFVPAPPAVVYEWLREPASYAAWWPGAGRSELRIGGARLTVVIAEYGERPGVGVMLDVAGDAEGTLEWYLEPFGAGTIVHAIAGLRPERPWRPRRVITFRGGIREGLVGLRRRASGS